MENVTIVSTWSDSGWNVYGKKWVESAKRFLPKEWHVKIYANKKSNNFKWVSWEEAFPIWNMFVTKLKNAAYDLNLKNPKKRFEEAHKFSFKSFVMMREIETCDTRYLIWLDGDAILQSQIPNNWPELLLDEKAMAVLFEYCEDEFIHCETGIVVFDLEHSDVQRYKKEFLKYYEKLDLLYSLKRPFDSFVAADVIKKHNISATNLNPPMQQITADPNITFSNPLLKEYVRHYILDSKEDLQ
jgi:hypothetical protein